MLIQFTVKNFRSFKEEATFSMIREGGLRLSSKCDNEDRAGGFQTLRTAAIFGPNAAGKSNLIHAMKVAQALIVNNTLPKRDFSFVLDKNFKGKPSSFEFEFKANGRAYSYGFETTYQQVSSEWLKEVDKKNQDKLIFERDLTKEGYSYNFDKTGEFILSEELNSLESISEGTGPSMLFLHDVSKIRKKESFSNQFTWFDYCLTILTTNEEVSMPWVMQLLDLNAFKKFISSVLQEAGTGIKSVAISENKEEIPLFIKEKLDTNLENGEYCDLPAVHGYNRSHFAHRDSEGKLHVYGFVCYHEDADGNLVPFEFEDESHGTQRLIDLAPAFFHPAPAGTVLIIDEVESQLHPFITKFLLQLHMDNVYRQNAQFIFSTHEYYLLNQDFLRRDQIWFVEKNNKGASEAYSLSEFDVRYDKDIHRDYMLGRYGAIPNIGDIGGI